MKNQSAQLNPVNTMPPPNRLFGVLALAMTLALSGNALLAAPAITNPSFEANSFTVFPGYWETPGNGVIVGWTASGGAGLNPAGGSPFADNGVIPNGAQVAFIQSGVSSSLSTMVSDLVVGQTYKVNFRVNARGGNTPNLKVDSAGVNLLNTAITAVGAANPYKYFAFDFTASATSQTLTFRNDAAGDHTVVLDDFSIAPRNSGWSYAAWTDDATSGVNSSKTYTHAFNFGSGTGTAINGVAFTGIGGGNPSSPDFFSTAGLPNVFPNDGNALAGGGSRQLANDFIYGGNPQNPQSLTINGLTPGDQYVATIYSVGWENGTRGATFSVGDDRLTVNQDHFGDNNGIRVSYQYTAPASSITLTFVPLQDATFHAYGFSNYEVGPPTPVNPSFEVDNFTVFPGYVSGNGPITGWNALGGHGVNPGTFGGPFTDNGTIPDGTKAAFLQEAGALSQVITGFKVGSTYQVRYFENARNCCTAGASPSVEVRVGGVTVVPAHASPAVGGSNPYREVLSEPFVATAMTLELAFIKGDAQPGDNTLLIDNVSIIERARVVGLFNSGVDNNGVALPDGAVDPHWTLVVNADGPSTDAIVHSSTVFPIVGGPWLANNATSKWIGPRLDTAGAAGEDKGNYVYRATFDLTGVDRASLTISGDWAVDNVGVALRINGTATGQVNNNGFAGLTPFTINAQNATFVAGLNTIEFEVLNATPVPGWTGLRIANLRGLADLSGTPPRIVSQPKGGLIGRGEPFVFTVVAGGSSPLAYEWRKDGTVLDGQTGPSLSIASATLGDNGSYTVQVSNEVGTVLSAAAVLTVLNVVTTVPGVFDTGVDNNRVALADGASDPHYRLVVNPDNTGETPVVEDSSVFPIVAGPWVANTATSKWIGPRFETSLSAGGTGAAGDYSYRLTIDLTGFDLGTFLLQGNWATDNGGLDITINGLPTGQQNTVQFAGYTPFVINSGFVAGLNQIEFKLNNSAVGYTGLRVSGLRALVRLGPVCPEAQPQSVTLNEDSPAPIVLGGTDLNDDALTFSIVTPPAHGTLSGTPPNLTYTPAPDYCGPDSFTFAANDGQCTSAAAQVALNVSCVNDNPIARIEVTPLVDLGTPSPTLLVLSINNSNACVTLDGSASSDAEPGPLEYDWFLDGGVVPIASGAIAPACLELGVHQVVLAVTDGQGGTGTANVAVEVITGAEAIDELIQQVDDSDLGRRNKRPFIATLKAVSASFDRGSIESALGQLGAFQNKVRAQLGESNPVLAAQWIRIAQSIANAVAAQQ